MICPVHCSWHRRALRLLSQPDAAKRLRPDLDLYGTLAGRAWAGCRCRLWERIQEAVKAA